MKTLLLNLRAGLACLGIISICVPMLGCAGTGATTTVSTATGSVAVPTNTVNIGYEIENYLQDFNTGLTASLPSVDAFLVATHNSGDATTVNMYATIASLASNVISAGLKAGLPAPVVQAQANAALVPQVAQTAAAVAVTPSSSMHWVQKDGLYALVSNNGTSLWHSVQD